MQRSLPLLGKDSRNLLQVGLLNFASLALSVVSYLSENRNISNIISNRMLTLLSSAPDDDPTLSGIPELLNAPP